MEQDKLNEIKNRMLSHNFLLGAMFASAIWLIIIVGYHLTN